MSLIVETGEGLPAAESLISVAEVRAYATSHGLTLPGSDAAVEILCRQASEWLGSLEDRLQGWRRVYNQGLCFPRVGVALFGRGLAVRWNYILAYLPEEEIHPDLKKGLCQMVYEMTLKDANPTVDARVVVSETVGPISTTYVNSGVTTQNPVFPKVMAFIQPFLKNSGASLQVSRA